MPAVTIEARNEIWPLREAFVISRGSKTAAEVVVVEISDGQYRGRGESVPYARYGETVAGVLDEIRSKAKLISTHSDLARHLKPGRRAQCPRLRILGFRKQTHRRARR